MGYIGIRTTGSIYGYRIERREFSSRARRRDEVREITLGIAEYLDQKENLPTIETRFGTWRRRRHHRGDALTWQVRHHLWLIERSFVPPGCGHPECRVAFAERRAELDRAEVARAKRFASGEIPKLLGRWSG